MSPLNITTLGKHRTSADGAITYLSGKDWLDSLSTKVKRVKHTALSRQRDQVLDICVLADAYFDSSSKKEREEALSAMKKVFLALFP